MSLLSPICGDFTPSNCQEVHSSSCAHCPSMQGTDPETEDIMTWPLEERMKTRFPCAWRNEKLCKGYHDKMKATK